MVVLLPIEATRLSALLILFSFVLVSRGVEVADGMEGGGGICLDSLNSFRVFAIVFSMLLVGICLPQTSAKETAIFFTSLSRSSSVSLKTGGEVQRLLCFLLCFLCFLFFLQCELEGRAEEREESREVSLV